MTEEGEHRLSLVEQASGYTVRLEQILERAQEYIHELPQDTANLSSDEAQKIFYTTIDFGFGPEKAQLTVEENRVLITIEHEEESLNPIFQVEILRKPLMTKPPTFIN